MYWVYFVMPFIPGAVCVLLILLVCNTIHSWWVRNIFHSIKGGLARFSLYLYSYSRKIELNCVYFATLQYCNTVSFEISCIISFYSWIFVNNVYISCNGNTLFLVFLRKFSSSPYKNVDFIWKWFLFAGSLFISLFPTFLFPHS